MRMRVFVLSLLRSLCEHRVGRSNLLHFASQSHALGQSRTVNSWSEMHTRNNIRSIAAASLAVRQGTYTLTSVTFLEILSGLELSNVSQPFQLQISGNTW